MSKKYLSLLCVLALLVAAICVTATATEESNVAEVNGTGYTTLAEAIANVSDVDPVSTEITLLQPVTEAVTFNKTAYLNLNGKDIGPVTVNEGCTLYCYDTETDDYVIEGDAENGYYGFGRLTVAEGSKGEIVGVSAGDAFADSYLKVSEDTGISFHCVTLRIDTTTLRPKNNGESAYNPGLYYKSTFAGDQLVAENVTQFGIALSVVEEPNADNFGVNNKCSVYEDFTAGPEGNANLSSTYVKNIMMESNGRLTNNSNARRPIYGKAYILTDDGVVFGKGFRCSFKERLEALSATETWNELSADDQQGMLAMYKPYQKLMKSWSVDGIRDTFLAEEDNIVRILNISNSHGQDSVWQLPDVIRTEKGEDYQFMVAECYFSGALTDHLNNANSYAENYIYWTNTGDGTGWDETRNVSIEYALAAERWDYIMFNESSRHLGLERYMSKHLIDEFLHYIDYRLDYEPQMFYNMTWSNPTDDRFHDSAYTSGKRRAPVENFKKNYTNDYGYDFVNHFNYLVEKTEEYLIGHTGFDKIMFTAAPVQYAQVRQDGGTTVPQWDDDQTFELYRDYTHLSDFARLMVAYQIYAQFFDLEEITAVNVDMIPAAMRATTWEQRLGDLTITDTMKQIIMDCVNYSLEDPLLKSVTTTPVVQDGASEFVIVHDGTEEAIALANVVRDTITANFGVTLEVGAAADLKQTYSTRQEIVIGNARGIAAKTMEKLTGEYDFAVEARGNKLVLCAKNEFSYLYLTEYVKREVLAATQSGDLVLDSDDDIIYSSSALNTQNYIDYCQAGNVTFDRDDIFSAAIYTNADTTLPYRLYVPFNYSPDKSYALMVSLHGAGHRGDNNSSQLGQLMKLMTLADATADEVIIVAPQCPLDNKWVDTDWAKGSYSLANTPESNELKAVMELLGQIQAKYNVNTKRIYACGYSMGGYGTWNLLMNHPDVFCAAVPMCGAADPSQAETLAQIPIWTVHGAKDPTVPVAGSQEIVAAIQAAGGTKINYTELPDHEHDVWTYTFTNAEIFNWLFSQVKE